MSSDPKHPWAPRYFEVVGAGHLPTSLARSPWDPRAIAGGSISALLAGGPRTQLSTPVRDRDIFGKVPSEPLTLASEVVRDGRQTKLHRVLRVRRLTTPAFAVAHDYPAPAAMLVEEAPKAAHMGGAITLRRVLGGPDAPGRAVAWWRGQETSSAAAPARTSLRPASSATSAAVFGNDTELRAWSYANLDITLQFLRSRWASGS
ncbi:MAG: hypothetical protein ABW128_15170 [Rhizorhabdus sp.]